MKPTSYTSFFTIVFLTSMVNAAPQPLITPAPVVAATTAVSANNCPVKYAHLGANNIRCMQPQCDNVRCAEYITTTTIGCHCLAESPLTSIVAYRCAKCCDDATKTVTVLPAGGCTATPFY